MYHPAEAEQNQVGGVADIAQLCRGYVRHMFTDNYSPADNWLLHQGGDR